MNSARRGGANYLSASGVWRAGWAGMLRRPSGPVIREGAGDSTGMGGHTVGGAWS